MIIAPGSIIKARRGSGCQSNSAAARSGLPAPGRSVNSWWDDFLSARRVGCVFCEKVVRRAELFMTITRPEQSASSGLLTVAARASADRTQTIHKRLGRVFSLARWQYDTRWGRVSLMLSDGQVSRHSPGLVDGMEATVLDASSATAALSRRRKQSRPRQLASSVDNEPSADGQQGTVISHYRYWVIVRKWTFWFNISHIQRAWGKEIIGVDYVCWILAEIDRYGQLAD